MVVDERVVLLLSRTPTPTDEPPRTEVRVDTPTPTATPGRRLRTMVVEDGSEPET